MSISFVALPNPRLAFRTGSSCEDIVNRIAPLKNCIANDQQSLTASVNSKKEHKVVHVRVVLNLVGVAVVRVSVLVLPLNGVAKQGHCPDGPLVDGRGTTNGKVTAIVP